MQTANTCGLTIVLRTLFRVCVWLGTLRENAIRKNDGNRPPALLLTVGGWGLGYTTILFFFHTHL